MFPYTTLLFKRLQDLYENDKNSSLFFKLFVSVLILTAILGPALFADVIIFIMGNIFRFFK